MKPYFEDGQAAGWDKVTGIEGEAEYIDIAKRRLQPNTLFGVSA